MNPEDDIPDEVEHEHRDLGRDNRGGKPRFRGPRGRPMKENDYSIR